MAGSVATSKATGTSPPDMPPGVDGSTDSGSGASRVHNAKPSGRGSPDATPSVNGSPTTRAAGDDAHDHSVDGSSARPPSRVAVASSRRRASFRSVMRATLSSMRDVGRPT